MDLIEESDAPADPPSPEELAEFKAQVSEWVKIDDQIKKLRIAMRERMVHQKVLGSKIQSFMKKHNYDNLHTQQGRIRHQVREVKTALKITDVKEKLYNVIQEDNRFDEETVKRIHDIFEAGRQIVKKESLKRDIPKVSLQIDL